MIIDDLALIFLLPSSLHYMELIRQSIFDRKYDRASGTVRLVDFIDNEYLPWAGENKRSYKDDEQRAVRIKEFFGKRLIRDVAQPLLVEKFKSKRRKSKQPGRRGEAPELAGSLR